MLTNVLFDKTFFDFQAKSSTLNACTMLAWRPLTACPSLPS